VLATALALRHPIIVPLDKTGERVKTLEPGVLTEDQVVEAAKEYLSFRYSWNPKDQAGRLMVTKKFVADTSRAAFDKTVNDLLQFSKDKSVFQRVYPVSINVDMERKTVMVSADRFDEIQGLKAASVLDVTLFFEKGKRTLENPWGFYVTKEEETAAP
jgi:hypothetical protein